MATPVFKQNRPLALFKEKINFVKSGKMGFGFGGIDIVVERRNFVFESQNTGCYETECLDLLPDSLTFFFLSYIPSQALYCFCNKNYCKEKTLEKLYSRVHNVFFVVIVLFKFFSFFLSIFFLFFFLSFFLAFFFHFFFFLSIFFFSFVSFFVFSFTLTFFLSLFLSCLFSLLLVFRLFFLLSLSLISVSSNSFSSSFSSDDDNLFSFFSCTCSGQLHLFLCI